MHSFQLWVTNKFFGTSLPIISRMTDILSRQLAGTGFIKSLQRRSNRRRDRSDIHGAITATNQLQTVRHNQLNIFNVQTVMFTWQKAKVNFPQLLSIVKHHKKWGRRTPGICKSVADEEKKVKGKVFPYSLLSIGPGADPSVQAVSLQVTWSE